MVEMSELRILLNKQVVLKWGKKEYTGKITIIDEDSETFSYEYDNEYQSAGIGGCAHRRNIIQIDGNTIYLK